MLVVATKEPLFAGVLSEWLAREFMVPCEKASSLEDAALLQPLLIITDRQDTPQPQVPIIAITPPIRLAELFRQVRSSQAINSGHYALTSDVVFDARMKQLKAPSGACLSLTDKEARLLEALLKAKEQGVSREGLLRQVWGIEPELNTHTLETHVYRLRAKLKDYTTSEIIEATDGGYRIAV